MSTTDNTITYIINIMTKKDIIAKYKTYPTYTQITTEAFKKDLI